MVEGSGEYLGLGLDLDPPAGIEVLFHDDQRRRRIYVAKEFAVSAADRVPVRGIGDIHPRSHYVFTRPTERLDRFENNLEAPFCLHVGITLDRFAVTVDGRRSGDRDARSPAYGARKADQALVRGRRTIAPTNRIAVLFLHVASLYLNTRPDQHDRATLRRRRETGSLWLVEVPRDPPRQPSSTLDVSLVIPVCNGADFVGDSVTRARNYLAQRCPAFEIVVVNDGSSDDTAAKVQPMTDNRVRLITLPSNAGKFAAVVAGMAATSGRCRVFTDADLPYDLEAIPYIVDLVANGDFHVVAGDRTLPESCSLTQTDVARQLSSRVFSFFVRMLVTGGLFDSQCGLKGFRSDVADALFPLLTHSGFSGDVELLYIALKHNLSIRRIPVRLQQSSPSTVKLTIHSLPMLIRILGLRHNWTSGRYDSEVLSGLGSQVYWPRADAPGRTTP